MDWIQLTRPAPILNTSHFDRIFHKNQVLVDAQGHPRSFEFVALPGMAFQIIESGPTIVKILCPTYSDQPLYTDRRFGRIVSSPPQPQRSLPNAQTLLAHMESRIGTPYVWGGNWAEGIPEMLQYYPPTEPLTPRNLELWTLQGLDCSGLLFEASGGVTPRNSGQLLKYGKALKISDLLKPLDMLVYPSHVLFVRDQKTIIESKSPFGVRICPLQDRFLEIQKERAFTEVWTDQTDPASHFMLRRFSF
jgi:hypothetical protein